MDTTSFCMRERAGFPALAGSRRPSAVAYPGFARSNKTPSAYGCRFSGLCPEPDGRRAPGYARRPRDRLSAEALRHGTHCRR